MPTKKQSSVVKRTPAKKAPNKKTSSAASKAPKKALVSKKVAVAVVQPKAKATKKQAGKKQAGCICVRTCSPEESFWVCDGPVVQSLEHLRSALKDMSEAQFAYHTRRDGNDFARWIRDCLKDDACARRVEKAKTRTTTIRALKSTCCK